MRTLLWAASIFLIIYGVAELNGLALLGGVVLFLVARSAMAPATARRPREAQPATGGGRRAPRQTGRRYLGLERSRGGLGADELASRLGLSVAELRPARARYESFLIPKRTGGHRRILAPDQATKGLQRRILHRVLARVPVHAAAHGFERGRSIVSNAAPHAGRAVVVRLDVVDFFASTPARRVRRLFRVLGWDRESAAILTRLTTVDGGLPQGAPTSPRLANLVNVRLDARLAGLARARGATYTRYADDLAFSFERDDPGAIHDVIRATKRILRQSGYRLHEGRKLRIRRRHERQLVTGLVVNERPLLPRARRRWLRAVEHHLRVGRPATLTEPQLTGWRAYELMIEAPTSDPGAESGARRA